MADVVSTALAALQADIEARATGLTLSWGEGDQAARDDGSPPRIVWVPTEDPIQRPDQAGSEEDEARVLWYLVNGFTAFVWGATSEQTRLLRNLVLGALYRNATTRAAPVSARWADDELRTSGSGDLCVIAFGIAEHVLDDAPTTVIPDTYEQDESEVIDP